MARKMAGLGHGLGGDFHTLRDVTAVNVALPSSCSARRPSVVRRDVEDGGLYVVELEVA